MSNRKPIDVTNLPTSNREYNDVTLSDDTSRLDAMAKVTGRAKYAMDRTEGKPILAAYVRCPWGSAEFVSADTKAAESVPGVIAVAVEENLGSQCTYHGQNMGYVAADSVLALRRGLRALNAQWKRLESRSSINNANPAMPKIGEDEQDRINLLINESDVVIDAVYETQVQTHSSLETHGGRVDFLGDRAVVYGSTQANFGFRDEIAGALDLQSSAIEMHCEYVGGGFGSKFRAGKEGRLAALLSKEFDRPCIVFCSRSEEHLDTGNRPSSRQHMKIAAKRDGRILGGQIITFGGVGVASRGGGVSSYRYNLGDIIVREHEDVTFNGGGPRAMRAPGHPQAMFAAELLMDEIAAGIGMDPLELRRMNDPAPERQAMYTRGAEIIGWHHRRPNGYHPGVVKRGYGIGVCDWPNFRSGAQAEVVIHPDGSVEAKSGTQDIGQGQRTAVAIVAASRLGVPLRMVEGKVGTTDLPAGPASGGSVTAPNTSPAVMEAAVDARGKLLDYAADALQTDASELDIVDGQIMRDGKVAMAWTDACRLMPKSISGRGESNRRKTDYRGEGHSNGVQFAQVAVDTETGVIKVERIVAIQACGKIICRKTAESQVLGGVIQGVSYALFENKLLDRQTAAMVNPNFEMYKIAGAVDIPEIIPVLWDDGADGVRSLGEPPTVPTAGAIATAVYNAIGAPVRSMPLTPDRVLAAMESMEGGRG